MNLSDIIAMALERASTTPPGNRDSCIGFLQDMSNQNFGMNDHQAAALICQPFLARLLEPDPPSSSGTVDLSPILTALGTIMADLSALQAEVQNNTSVEQSAITLLNGLAAQLAAAGTDPAALAAIVTQLQTNDAALAAAVAANTPAPPPPPPGPSPLTVSPSSLSLAVGGAVSGALTASGGVAPYSFSSSLSDVTVDGAGNLGGTPAAAETGSITVTDSSSPAQSVTVSVSVA